PWHGSNDRGVDGNRARHQLPPHSKLSGSALLFGIDARPTSTGMSGILRAVSISILTGSSLSPLILNIPPFFAPPLRTDQDKHHVVFGHHLLDLLPKINSKGDTVDIHENSIGTIVLSQTIANAASNGGGIRTPIRNYYVGHGCGHLRLSLKTGREPCRLNVRFAPKRSSSGHR